MFILLSRIKSFFPTVKLTPDMHDTTVGMAFAFYARKYWKMNMHCRNNTVNRVNVITLKLSKGKQTLLNNARRNISRAESILCLTN